MLLELGGHHAALGGLLDRQADAAAVDVEVDDLHPQLLAGGHHLLGQVDVVGGDLRDVHQALDALAHLHKGPERHQLGNPAVHQLSHLVAGGELLPGVLLGGLQRQADALPVEVHFQHLHLDLVAHLHHRTGVIHVLPRQLGYVHQAVHAAQIHESAEVHHRRHHAAAALARLEVVQEGLALLLLGLLQPRPTGQHHVVAVLVQLDDLGLQGLADIGLEVAHPAQFHQGCGQKAPQADVHDQTALDHFDHGARDGSFLLLDLFDVAPCPLVLGPLLGEDQVAVLVLLLEHQGLDLLAEGDDLAGVHHVADGQLPGGDDPLRLVADVQQHLVAVNLHHLAGHDLAVFHLDHGGGVCVVQELVFDVLVGDLTRDVVPLSVKSSHTVGGVDHSRGGWRCGLGGWGGIEVGHVELSLTGGSG